jgi:DNA invertase Pin-like site-specific DNA recombinase
MLVGYGRTSSITQEAGLEAQERDLKAVGVEKLFTEQVSSVAERAQLEAALDFCRARDALVVTRLDRLARSIRDLCSIVDRLEAKGVSLRILGVWSRPLMGHPYRVIRRMRYGPSSAWERHDDRGDPSSDTA